MPRKKLIVTDFYPYHVTGRVNNKELFPLPLEDMWKIMTHELLLLSILFEIEIHAFVLMPNHFHLMLTSPHESLGKVMNLFMSDVTRIVNHKLGKSGHLFGGPYFWSIVTNARYFGHALKYIYRNPVRAGLCISVESYEFTTINGLLGFGHAPFPIHFTRAGMEQVIPDPDNHHEWLKWLNVPFSSETEILIQSFFRKKEIKALIELSSRTVDSRLSMLL